MVYRILKIGWLSLMLCACGTEPAGDSVSTTKDSVTKNIPAESKALQTARRVGAGFGQSINKVYGIKIPTGMVPAKGPERVVRFRGKPSIAQVVDSVRSQVRAQKEIREGEGYLFRFARADKDYVKRDLAIRVFSHGGATTLDIWKEHRYVDNLPEKSASKRQRKTVGRETVSRVDGAKIQRRRQERFSDAMRILQKMQRKESLTEEEKNSALFN